MFINQRVVYFLSFMGVLYVKQRFLFGTKLPIFRAVKRNLPESGASGSNGKTPKFGDLF